MRAIWSWFVRRRWLARAAGAMLAVAAAITANQALNNGQWSWPWAIGAVVSAYVGLMAATWIGRTVTTQPDRVADSLERSLGGPRIGSTSTVADLPAMTGPVTLPAAAPGFVSRDVELGALLAALEPNAGPVTVVTGPPGVGKSELVLQTAHSARSRGLFPGGVIHVTMLGYDSVPMRGDEAIDTVLRALKVPVTSLPADSTERRATYLAKLGELTEPLLVVADNASSAEQVIDLVPGVPHHRLIVTSRTILPQLRAHIIELSTLDAAKSIDVLDAALRVARPDDDRVTADPTSAARIATLCGGLALALQVAAFLLVSVPTATTAGLADRLKDERTRLARLRSDDHHPVIAAFELSYRRLPAVPARLFRLMTVNPGPDVTFETLSHVYGETEDDLDSALAHLVAAHLVEPSSPGRWRMHDLLRIYAAEQAEAHADDDHRSDAVERLLAHYGDVTEAASACLIVLPSGDTVDQFPHRMAALEWLENERANLVASVTTYQFADPAAATRIGRYVLWFLYQRRYLTDLGTVCAVGRAAADRATGDPAPDFLLFQSIIPRVNRELDTAVSAARSAVEEHRASGHTSAEADALLTLSTALHESGQDAEAKELCLMALEIKRALDEDLGVGMAMSNLSLICAALDDLDEGREYADKAVALVKPLGVASATAMALNNLSTVLGFQGHHDAAIAAIDEALALVRESGINGDETLILINKADLLDKLDRRPESVELLREAGKKADGLGDRYMSGLVRGQLARLLYRMRNHADALVEAVLAAEIMREFGEKEKEARYLRVQGWSLNRLNRMAEAELPLSRAVALLDEANEPWTLGYALSDWGEVLLSAGRHEDALRAYLQSCDLLISDDPDASRASARGASKSLSLIGTIAVMDYAVAPSCHDYPAQVLARFAYTLADGSRLDEAEGAVRAAVDLARAASSPRQLSFTLRALSWTLGKLGRPDEGCAAASEAVVVARSAGLLTSEADAHNMLASALDAAGRSDEVMAAFEDGIRLAEQANDFALQADITENLGLFQLDQDDMTGFVTIEKALGLAKASGRRRLEAEHAHRYGFSLMVACRTYSEAAAVLRRSRDLYEELSDFDESVKMTGLVIGCRICRFILPQRKVHRERAGRLADARKAALA